MQLEGLKFMLFLLIISPIIILSSNHNFFFLMVAIVLVIFSFISIYRMFFDINDSISEEDIESTEELEDSLGVDVRKFGIGIKIMKNSIIILFFSYCIFYMSHLWMKLLVPFIIVYWLHDMIHNSIEGEDSNTAKLSILFNNLFFIFVNIASIIIILFVAYVKITNNMI